MKINETVRMKLIINTKSRADRIERVMANYISKLETIKNVEELMKAKKYMLSDLVHGIPIGTDTCYFCQLEKTFATCKQCEYGEVHKICTNENSDYKNISNAIKELQHLICNYYKDENYSMVAKKMKARRLKV